MADPLRIAFLGAGGITRRHAAAVISHPDKFTAIGIADPHRPAAEKLAAGFEGDVPVFDSHTDLLDALGDRVDGAVITTPHFLHFPMAMDCLRHGVPALVEKPVACKLEQMRRLQAAEAESDAFLMVGQMQRFGKLGRWLRDWVCDEERCGVLQSFQIECWQNLEGYLATRPDPWVLDGEKAGGGICISVAIHQLDLLRFVSGADYAEVSVTGRFDPPMRNGAESVCMGWLRMDNGVIGSLNASYVMVRCGYSQGTLLSGSRGTVFPVLDEWGAAYAQPYAASGVKPITSFGEMFGDFKKVTEEESFLSMPGEDNHFIAQFLEFGAAIREARKPCDNTLEKNFNTLAVIEALAASMHCGKPCEVEKS